VLRLTHTNDKHQRDVNHRWKGEVLALKKPANRRTSETELPLVLRDVSGVVLIFSPELLAGHRVWRPVPPSRVPGLFVGAEVGGGDDGCGALGAGADGCGACVVAGLSAINRGGVKSPNGRELSHGDNDFRKPKP
jgi:hypothetical protein